MLQGLRTAIYYVNDIEKAKAWYTRVLGFGPYFDQPFYVGFNVGGYELGLHPEDSAALRGSAGVIAYWGVENADDALERLLILGATRKTDVTDVGGEIRVADVIDPFGNVFGIIENPRFKLPA